MKSPLDVDVPKVGDVFAYGPNLLSSDPGGHALVQPSPNYEGHNDEAYYTPLVTSLLKRRTLQFGAVSREAAARLQQDYASVLCNDEFDGRAHLVHGLGQTFLTFRAHRFQSRPPGGSLTFFTAGEGRPFEQMLELSKRDYPKIFEQLGALGTEVRLAGAVTLPDGSTGYPLDPFTEKPILPMFRVERAELGEYRKVSEGRNLADLGYASTGSLSGNLFS